MSPDELVQPAELRSKLNLLPYGTSDPKADDSSVYIINTYNPNFVFARLNGLDHQQHPHGPFGP